MINMFSAMNLGAPEIAYIIVILALFAFEVAMLVSLIRNKQIGGNAKALWIIGMLFIHPFVAIAYYFKYYRRIV